MLGTFGRDAGSRRDERHFRLHDSGDFFSPPYVDAWYDIAFALPEVSFWAPTRSWAITARSAPTTIRSLSPCVVSPSCRTSPSARARS
ncbi:MAG: hypothetical protein IPF66_24500 [Holophagales bacterium]|nr:hypothetical protein [Holophagales bacterium]